MLQHDCFDVLGVPRDASRDQIRRAYHRLVLQYHPDVNPDLPDAALRLRHIVEAYEQLREHAPRSLQQTSSCLSAIQWEFGSWQADSNIRSRWAHSFKPFILGSLVATVILTAGFAFCRSTAVPIEWQDWKPTYMRASSNLYSVSAIEPNDRLAVEFWKKELEMRPLSRLAAHNLASTYEQVARTARVGGNQALADYYYDAAKQVHRSYATKPVSRSRSKG